MIEKELYRLGDIYAAEIFSYDILENRVHIVAQFRPDLAARWSNLEVAQRSLELMPKATFPEARAIKAAAGVELTTEQLARRLAQNEAWIEQQRRRLRSPSWFMKSWKEIVARKVNAEDNTTGAFWEGRFKCSALLDPAAVLSCCIYVDLNQIRARMADRLEDCTCCSIVRRLAARQTDERDRSLESGHWLRSLEIPDGETGPACELGVTLDQYLQLVEATGRQIRENCGRIDPTLEPILERLELNSRRWGAVMGQAHRFRGTAIGSAERRRAEAQRRNARWVVGRSGVHLN
jgi:hypothetical protein